MACDKTALYEAACANGFAQAAQNEQLYRALELQLLCEISEGGGGGGGGIYSGNYSGGQPNFTPSETTAIAFDTSTGAQWSYYSGAWH
jgi:hypothetical protein